MDTSWLRFVVLGTYLFQTIQLVFFPVPSSVSTKRLLSVSKGSKKAARDVSKEMSVHLSRTKVLLLSSIALSAFCIALLPLFVMTVPGLYGNLFPIPIGRFQPVRVASVCLLVFGTGLTLAAVLRLRSGVRFNSVGGSENLYTGGIFMVIRNPIVVGMGIIYLGLFFALPSLIMLLGLVLFILNQKYRVRMEETYLAGRFGKDYFFYKECVGRYFPKLFNKRRKAGAALFK